VADPDWDALLDTLRALPNKPDGAQFTRPNLIALLDVLTTHLGAAIETEVGELEDGIQIITEHPVVDQLSGLVQALRDLDIGLIDPVFKPTLSNKNALRHWRERQEDKDLIEGIKILQRVNKFKSFKATAMAAQSMLGRINHTRRGKRLSWKDLINLHHRQKKQ
jgi:hypothetical protein